MILFFDTETTGKADFKKPAGDACQPRLVQLAALLTTDEGHDVASINLIVKPDGFAIPSEAAAIHGITTEQALSVGVTRESVLPIFAQLCESTGGALVGHNIDFDLLVMDGEFERFDQEPFRAYAPFCTMRAMAPVCKIANPYGYADYKWPKLQEAYFHCFGRAFDGAHNAMADVRACSEVYFWLKANSENPIV